ncbi:MAG: 2-phosphosulfolactate phosphatase [Acidimicrobiia bacterium]
MHLEWGRAGLREAGRQADVVVVVDVLSFTTAVTVAAEHDVVVHPIRPGEPYAASVARRLGAHLAGKRGAAAVSLSPGTLACLDAGERVVLASPHGATLALEAAATGASVVAASLRNAAAVGRWLGDHQRRVVVIAAGETWRDGAPRTAIEDLLGAGALLSHFPAATVSAEARVAAEAFRGCRGEMEAILRGSTSGRELAALGYVEDVICASQLDASTVVPVLADGAFRPS